MSKVQIKKVNNYMAILRNLRNISQAGVSDEHIDKVCAALTHLPAIENSKQLPFRFYSAYTELQKAGANQKLVAAAEKAMELSIVNLPRLEGNVASLCDNSGSAHGAFTSSMGTVSVASIANLQSVITAMVTEGEATVYPFGDRLESVKIDRTQGIFAQLEKVNKAAKGVGNGTETGIWLFWDKAIKNKTHYDHVFVYSDMQAGHGGLYASGAVPKEFSWDKRGGRHIDVAALINKYRAEVNANVQVYLVQVAGYGDTIVPEIYDKTYILGGWSTGILNFADKVSTLNP